MWYKDSKGELGLGLALGCFHGFPKVGYTLKGFMKKQFLSADAVRMDGANLLLDSRNFHKQTNIVELTMKKS